MGAGLISISAYSGGGPSYSLTVDSSSGVSVDDHVSDGAGNIYRATSVPDSTTINIQDDVEPDAPVGTPTTGNGAFWTATDEHSLSQAPFSTPYWDAIWRRDMRQIDDYLGAHGTAGGDLSGEYPDPEVQSVAKSLRLLGGLIAPTILGDQDDYYPTGLEDMTILRISSDAARSITGLDTGVNGRFLVIFNGGSYPITFKHEDSSSLAANRFLFENDDDAILAPDGGMVLIYCGDSTRWRTATATNALRNGDTAGGDLTGTYPDPSVVQSSETVAGKIEIADQTETDTGTDDTKAITPDKLANAATVVNTGDAAGGDLTGTYPDPSVVQSSETVAGKIEVATQTETDTGTDDERAITPDKLANATTVVKPGDAAGGDLTGTYPDPSVVQASTTVAGKIEIATDGEVDTGTDTDRAVTPAGLAQADTVVKPGDAAGGDLGGTYPNPSVKGRLLQRFEQIGTTLDPSTTDLTYTSAIPQMSQAITPGSASNWIRVAFTGDFYNSNDDKGASIAIFIDSTEQPASQRSCIVRIGEHQCIAIERYFQLTAAAHTIEIRWKTTANTLYAADDNRSLIVEEYSALS
jgi:hypothetical protein